MRLPSFEPEVLNGPFKFVSGCFRVFGCKGSKANESVRISLYYLRELIINLSGKSRTLCGVKLLNPRCCQAEYLHINSCRIHVFQSFLSCIKKLVEKNISEWLPYIISVI